MIKELINNIVKLFNYNPIPFILISIGAIAQSLHTYFLAQSINALEEPLRTISSVLLGIFFSAGLLYFSVKLGLSKVHNEDTPETKVEKIEDYDKYSNATTAFQTFEIFINIFYYINKWAYKGAGIFDFTNWFPLLACGVFAIFLPTFLRYYAGQIRIKESTDDKSLISDGDYEISFENEDRVFNIKLKRK